MKKRFNITAALNKEIKETAAALPMITALNPKGQPMLDFTDEMISWEDLSTEDKKQYPEKQFEEIFRRNKSGQKIPTGKYRELKYWQRVSRPRYVNHYIKIISAYQDNGMAGVYEYVEKINEVTKQSVADAIAAAASKPTETNGEV